MTKKDDVTTYTKAELIKALRASVAREAKLQKRIAALEGQIAATMAMPSGVKPAPPPECTCVECVDAADTPAPPAFPWDVK